MESKGAEIDHTCIICNGHKCKMAKPHSRAFHKLFPFPSPSSSLGTKLKMSSSPSHSLSACMGTRIKSHKPFKLKMFFTCHQDIITHKLKVTEVVKGIELVNKSTDSIKVVLMMD